MPDQTASEHCYDLRTQHTNKRTESPTKNDDGASPPKSKKLKSDSKDKKAKQLNGRKSRKSRKNAEQSNDEQDDEQDGDSNKEDKEEHDKQKEKEKDGEEDLRPWRERPPYVPENPKKAKEAKYKGSCHCKDVTFELYADPKDAHFCHCDDCQKLHGAPAHWSCIMPKTDVLFTSSTENLMFYRTKDNSNEYRLPLKISCKRCHSAICDEGQNMMLMYPSLVDFPDAKSREAFTPRRHVFYSMRALDVYDGQEKYEGMQFKSKLMDEKECQTGSEGITGKGSRKDRVPGEKDSKDRSDNPK